MLKSGASKDISAEEIGEAFTEDDVRRAGPLVNILSNGKMVTAVTAAGAGCTACDGVLLNRWRPDASREADGYFVFVRDLETGRYWSTALQPDCIQPDEYSARFDAGRVQFERLQDGIRTRLEMYVSTEEDADVRRLTIRNESARPRHIDVTSFFEVLLNERLVGGVQAELTGAELTTAYDADAEAISIAGAPDEAGRQRFLIHLVQGDGDAAGFSVSRRSFIGRGRTTFDPAGMDAGASLDESTGSTTDPIAVLRRVLRIAPGAEAGVTFILGFANSRSEGSQLVERLSGRHNFADDAKAAAAREVERLLMLRIDARQARYFRRLGAALYYDDRRFRAPEEIVTRLAVPLDRLRAYDLVPGRPLVVARIASREDLALERTLLKAHRYWLSLGLSVDLFFLNDKSETEAAEELQSLIERTATDSQAPIFVRGGVYSEYADDIPPEDQILIQSAANILIRDSFPRLDEEGWDEEVADASNRTYQPAAGAPGEVAAAESDGAVPGEVRLRPDADGNLVLPETPVRNTIRNAQIGFSISERGAGHTWYGSENQMLSRPPDDTISDAPGEALYLRDESEGTFWSLFPGPAPAPTEYRIQHADRSSRVAHAYSDLRVEVDVSVAQDEPLKLIRVRLDNLSEAARGVSIFYYLEPVLGEEVSTSSRFVATEWDRSNRALILRNEASAAFSGKSAFAAARGHEGQVFYSGSREFFLGRCGDSRQPRAVSEHDQLDGSTGATLDACAALQWRTRLDGDSSRHFLFAIGVAGDRKQLRQLLSRAEPEAE